MKWKHNTLGDTRTRRIFAFIARRCEDGYTRWLEWLDVTEVYRSGGTFDEGYWSEYAIHPASTENANG